MEPNDDQTISADVVASEAEPSSSPDVTEGSGSSPEATEVRSPGEIVRDEFLKKFGEEEPPAASVPAEPEAPTTEGTPEVERQEGAGDDKAPRIPDEVFKVLPQIARDRLQYQAKLIGEAKKAAAEATRQVEDYQPAHEAVEKLQGFARDHNLTGDDVTKGLSIMGKLQTGDFEGFLTAIEPFYAMARQATGKAVAPNIQALVDSGDVTQEAALLMTKAEQRAALAEAAAERVRGERETEQQETSRQTHLKALMTAVRDTEAALRLSDPDYALKAPAIQAQFGALLKRGAIPKDAADAAALVREIHQSVMVNAPKPPLQATPARPGASTQTGLKTAPTNTLEAVEMAFAQMAGR